MDMRKLGIVETHFAELIWQNEPLSSGDLVQLCWKELQWKKPTTYTALRKLCERGLFRNENSVVTSCVSREEYYAFQSEQFLEETFNGSLPAFFAAFASRKPLSSVEVEQLQRLINEYKEKNK
ncbi:MAG: BlaI/MecI/CopY family transcriptional regulator [Clostridia bacterium]|nr:BlaI/MecI/CopY family transcriptional regulator [Clostridia bacterium]